MTVTRILSQKENYAQFIIDDENDN